MMIALELEASASTPPGIAPAEGFRSPNLDDFVFFGFAGLMPELERSARHVEIRGGEPTLAVVENAVYVPAEQTGLLRRQRGALADGFAPAGSAPPTRVVDEEAVYLGWLFNHYGHFLMQSLARTWFLTEVDPSVKVIFHHSGRARWRPAGWALRLLEAFGIPQERMLVLDEPTRLRRVYVPEPLFEPRSVAADRATVRVHEAMAGPYRAVAERLAGDVTPSAQPLYLSRRFLPSSQRLMVGEAELEEVLRQNGFRIAHPQLMPLREQVRLINGHTDIVSNAGSAAQNVLFALHAPRLHLLTNGALFSPDYFMHATLVGARTGFINGLGTAGRKNYPGNHTLTPHLVDVATCVAYLEQRGLLSAPPALPDRERLAALRTEYDETWLSGRVRTATINRRKALPAAIETEALAVAATSWPVSLSLARYYATRDDARLDELATQFATLAAQERDPERLERYRDDAEHLVRSIAERGRAALVRQVARVVADRFLSLPEPSAVPDSGGRRKTARRQDGESARRQGRGDANS